MGVENGSRSSLVIGTRGSRLAIIQAEWVQARLKEIAPYLSIRLQRIRTSGDKITDVPLAKIGGKGLFVKEIEEAILCGEIDLAVHSMKDVPSALPQGLAIVCIPEREDSRDVLLSRDGLFLQKLRLGAQVGTSSLRRQAQILFHRSDLSIHMLRGNLDTRLRKLRDGEYDAIVLAAAGLRRLGWSDQVTEYLSPQVSLPAIGQGALALEGRQEDFFVQELLGALDHPSSRLAVSAERAFLARLEGGCQLPIAGHAIIHDQILSLDGLVASVDGKQVVRDTIRGPVEEASQLGMQLAERLLGAGGDCILKDIYGRA